jgi:hypothetical protein
LFWPKLSARKPFRIRTSTNSTCNPFRIRTSAKKRGVGSIRVSNTSVQEGRRDGEGGRNVGRAAPCQGGEARRATAYVTTVVRSWLHRRGRDPGGVRARGRCA